MREGGGGVQTGRPAVTWTLGMNRCTPRSQDPSLHDLPANREVTARAVGAVNRVDGACFAYAAGVCEMLEGGACTHEQTTWCSKGVTRKQRTK